MNAYQKLVEEFGEERAREIMRERRAMVKNIPGGAFKDKTFASLQGKKGGLARKGYRKDAKDKDTKKRQTIQPVDKDS